MSPTSRSKYQFLDEVSVKIKLPLFCRRRRRRLHVDIIRVPQLWCERRCLNTKNRKHKIFDGLNNSTQTIK